MTRATYPVWLAMTHLPSFPDGGLTIVRAEGVWVWDDTGRRYLSGNSGLWNVSCGYADPRIVDAVCRQLTRLSYGTLFRSANDVAVHLAERLLELGPPGMARVFYACSGSSAIDHTIKLVTRWQRLCGRPQRDLVVGLEGSYHGTTYGALGLTGEDLGQSEYAVELGRFRHVPPNDVAALQDLVRREGDRLAAIIVEPVLGTGCIPLDAEFVGALAETCDARDCLLVADEVATGFGRTGRMFASEAWGRPPDLLLLSKAINSGYLPMAAVLVGERVARAFDEADIVFASGETGAGHPAACAAALATLDVMRDDDLVARASAAGERLRAGLEELEAHPLVAGQRGMGLMRSLLLRRADGDPIDGGEMLHAVAAVREEGAIVHPEPRGLGLLPPLVISEDELDELLDCVARGLEHLWF